MCVPPEHRRAARGTVRALRRRVHQLDSCHHASNPSGVLTRWDHAGFHVSAEHRGAGGTAGGGDFYTLAVRAPGHIGVVIGDACGRGADGEAQISRILPKVRELALSGASPAELLTELNRTVAATLPTDRFVTAAAFEFDMGAGVLTVANAAHVPAMLRRVRDRHVSIVGRATEMPLGIVQSTTYRDEHYELNRGDVVVLMTDGVLEAVESDLLSMSTLQRFLSEASEGAGDVHRFLLRKFEECTTGKRVDDMTLVALEATGEPLSRDFAELARAS
jgi:serine phosphatase RsbU (regulator of sigma subunit)